MKEFVEKLIERLEEKRFNADLECASYKNKAGTLFRCADKLRIAYIEAIEIVNQLAEEYMTCYKSCTECEAYDKENHHCPKFCYIIAETVKEIEENHNGWIPVAERLPEDKG